jgi:hypothetical protein
MPKVYCQDCGQPAEYSTKKPNFCPACGFSFGAAKPAPAPKPQIKAEVVEGEERIPEIDGLEVEIVKPPTRRTSYGDVVRDGINNPVANNIQRPKAKKASKKEIQEMLRKEGGNTPGQSITVGGEE